VHEDEVKRFKEIEEEEELVEEDINVEDTGEEEIDEAQIDDEEIEDDEESEDEEGWEIKRQGLVEYFQNRDFMKWVKKTLPERRV
jgi:hypothetical protein